MKRWIDPRERRARWYWLTGFVLCILTLAAAASVLLWAEQTVEERMMTIVIAVLAPVAAAGSLWQLKQYPKDLQQYEEPQ
jgi:protein-S-isoprenylcysteine O-methyltransferase Ste14